MTVERGAGLMEVMTGKGHERRLELRKDWNFLWGQDSVRYSELCFLKVIFL